MHFDCSHSTPEGTHTVSISSDALEAIRDVITVYLQDRDIKVDVRDTANETEHESELKDIYEAITAIVGK